MEGRCLEWGEGELEWYPRQLEWGEGGLEWYPRQLEWGEDGLEWYPRQLVGRAAVAELAVAEEGKIGTALVEEVLRRSVAMEYLPEPHLPVLGLWKSLSLFEHRLRWSVGSLVSHRYCL